jgi:hypothetical protein
VIAHIETPREARYVKRDTPRGEFEELAIAFKTLNPRRSEENLARSTGRQGKKTMLKTRDAREPPKTS